MKIKIDKNIPIFNIMGKEKTIKYPFHEMRIGDSFAINCSEKCRKTIQSNVLNSFRNINKNIKVKLISRSFNKGMRFWLTKNTKKTTCC